MWILYGCIRLWMRLRRGAVRSAMRKKCTNKRLRKWTRKSNSNERKVEGRSCRRVGRDADGAHAFHATVLLLSLIFLSLVLDPDPAQYRRGWVWVGPQRSRCRKCAFCRISCPVLLRTNTVSLAQVPRTLHAPDPRRVAVHIAQGRIKNPAPSSIVGSSTELPAPAGGARSSSCSLARRALASISLRWRAASTRASA